MKFNIMVKIGGSIFEFPKLLDNFLHSFLNHLNPEVKYLILAGGGNACNLLREEYRRIPKSQRNETDFHWKSISIMDKTATILFSHLTSISKHTLVRKITNISQESMNLPGIYILRPFDDLHSSDPLEHSWQVTSDSISIYYAKQIRSPICVLVKNNPYLMENNSLIYSISSTRLISLQKNENKEKNLGKGFVDPLSPILCRDYKIPILVLDGTNPKHVAGFLSLNVKNLTSMNLSGFGIIITPE